MKKFLPSVFAACLLLGCGDSETTITKEEDKKLREQMSKPFDINNVPPDQREKVKAFMEMGKNQAAPPSAPK